MSEQPGRPERPRIRMGFAGWMVVVMAVGGLLATGMIINGPDSDDGAAASGPTPTARPAARRTPTPTPRPTALSVSIYITGTARGAEITYSDGRGGIHQTRQKLPWDKTLTVPIGAPVTVSAQNTEAVGAVACRISVNGLTKSTATADVAYGIASCSALVGQ